MSPGSALGHLVAGLAVLSLLFTATSQGQPWELRVCGHRANLPYSNAAGEGFEDRLAELIAHQLDASLSFERLDYSAPDAQLQALHSGRCDVIMGVGEGSGEILTTVAYYRSSYVFVYRRDEGTSIESLDDPELARLRIGVQAGAQGPSPVGYALAARGLSANQVIFRIDPEGNGSLGEAVAAVAEGAVDLAIIWGPVAGYYASRQPVPLELTPVKPEIVEPFIPMVSPVAAGVRPGDEALRDGLNSAIAARWDEIQALLEEYRVPLEPLPRPTVALGGGQ